MSCEGTHTKRTHYRLKGDDMSKLETAFMYGFMVSREGFNAECACEALAPSNLEAHKEEVAMFMLGARHNDTLLDLMTEAVEMIKTEEA
jgi:hypothetical protein